MCPFQPIENQTCQGEFHLPPHLANQNTTTHTDYVATLQPPSPSCTHPRVPDFNPPADGYKRFVFPDGKGVYDGHWRGCKRHGQGSFAFANGDVYDGELLVFALGEEAPSADSRLAASSLAWVPNQGSLVLPPSNLKMFAVPPCLLVGFVSLEQARGVKEK